MPGIALKSSIDSPTKCFIAQQLNLLGLQLRENTATTVIGEILRGSFAWLSPLWFALATFQTSFQFASHKNAYPSQVASEKCPRLLLGTVIIFFRDIEPFNTSLNSFI